METGAQQTASTAKPRHSIPQFSTAAGLAINFVTVADLPRRCAASQVQR